MIDRGRQHVREHLSCRPAGAPCPCCRIGARGEAEARWDELLGGKQAQVSCLATDERRVAACRLTQPGDIVVAMHHGSSRFPCVVWSALMKSLGAGAVVVEGFNFFG